ncbi:MAG: sugar phosphate nucleotidyltransferase [bacterium]|nr:sugar phosphate nucleotidyltransferase [bacterium]
MASDKEKKLFGNSTTGQAVIIAAGESSRFWPLSNGIHKSQTFLLGKPLIYWTLKGLCDAGIKDVVVVHAKDSSLPAMLGQENDLGIKISFAVQEEPLGTGNALWQAKKYITGPFFVLWPDKVVLEGVIREMIEKYKQEGLGMVLLGAYTSTPWDYGIFSFENGIPSGIEEKPNPGKEPSNVKAVGLYLFEQNFFNYYATLPQNHETDFNDVINIYMKERRASLVLLKKDAPTLKYPWNVFSLSRLLMDAFLQSHVASNATIAKNAVIEGTVYIGEGARIFENAVIKGPCYIGKNCVIGTNALIRDYTNLEEGVVIGAHGEVTRSIFQKGTHSHQGFFGDSIVGENCRFGAGFITANRRFDGAPIKAVVKDKKVDTEAISLGAIVGNGTQVGIHVGTMPGVLIGSLCQVGPGTMVFKNIPDNTKLSVRFNQDSSPA